MDAAAVETAKGMGWPWDAYAEAVYARQEAERAAEIALGAGDTNDRAAAARELSGALWHEQVLRGELADVFLLMLRQAIGQRPDVLLDLCSALALEADWRELRLWLATLKPGGMRWNAGLERRVEAAEAEVRRLKAENWDLACGLATLKLRIEQMERTTNGDAQADGPSGAGGAEGGAGVRAGLERPAG